MFFGLGYHPALRPLDYHPHLTRLMDWLPYGSGGFLLFQDSVVWAGIEPATRRFSVYCSTYWAITPNLRLRNPLCCLTSDTHSLSVLLLGHVTIPFSREQHKLEIVKEYPSRSNLNCLIVVLRGLGRKGDEFRFHPGLSTSIGWGKPLSMFYKDK